jgi:hypothetical protein
MINKILVLGMMVQAISSGRDRVMPENPDGAQPEVLVRVFGVGAVSGLTMAQGEVVAKQILASAGVRIRWVVSAVPRGPKLQSAACENAPAVETIDIRFTYSMPAEYKRGVLAEARPFAKCGVRITVFFDRVSRIFDLRLAPDATILGHVLAHEMGHVLLQLQSHSETGLMKARWNDHDFVQMRSKKFAFTPEEIAAIQSNLAKRANVTLVSRAF